jgi:hypothetical protein
MNTKDLKSWLEREEEAKPRCSIRGQFWDDCRGFHPRYDAHGQSLQHAGKYCSPPLRFYFLFDYPFQTLSILVHRYHGALVIAPG